MGGREIKIFLLVRATTWGRPYGVQNTHRKNEQIGQKQRHKVPQGSHKTPAKRVLWERGGADHKVNLRGKAAK